MKKITMMWALLATVLLSVVGCKNTEPEPEVQKPTISVAEAVVNAEREKAAKHRDLIAQLEESLASMKRLAN